MKAILKDGTTRELNGADIKEISVSVLDDTLIIFLHSGEVLMARSLHAKD